MRSKMLSLCAFSIVCRVTVDWLSVLHPFSRFIMLWIHGVEPRVALGPGVSKYLSNTILKLLHARYALSKIKGQ